MPLAANRVFVCLLALAGAQAPLTPARAGGGPANVMLVVNSGSPDSKHVGNHYAWLRRLPPANVLYLDYDGPRHGLSADRFEKELLRPLLKAIDSRGLSPQIDTVAYSTDFPWRIDFTQSFDPKELSRINRPFVSLTGATYLYNLVLARSPSLLSLRSNLCVPTPPGSKPTANLGACRSVAESPSRALRSRYAWKPDGTRAPNRKAGLRYLMSSMLGVTDGRGNTVEEIIACLDRAAEADFTQPGGTFCFMRREGAPRSKPRHACFDGVVRQLRELGADARVERGTVPKAGTEIAGLMIGAPTVSIDPSETRLIPGAIAEHLTSYGGVLSGTGSKSQTALTDLIRAGATGTCGTVFEPFAIQAKFPLPSLHLHYRRGCSMGESFYQSVAAPYQLLIVGDPLCQPWADRPGLRVDGWPHRDALTPIPTLSDSAGGADEESASLRVQPRITPSDGEKQGVWEFYLDGRLRARGASGKELVLPADKLGPGWHELLLAGIDTSPIECQREAAGEIEVLGRNQPVRLRARQPRSPLGSPVVVTATAPGAERVVIKHNLRVAGTLEGESGEVEIDSSWLGRGRVRLQAFAEPGGAASPPVWVRVE